MYNILCLYPFGQDNAHPGWHIVILDKWFKIKNLPSWCQTSFCYSKDDQVFSFYRYWGPGRTNHEDIYDNISTRKYKHYFFQAPWCRFLYKKEYLKRGEWIPFSDLSFDTQQREGVLQDIYNTSFKFTEDGSEIKADATIRGERLYYGVYWFPRWLKPLFAQVHTTCWINFSTDIGCGRGTYKGGTTALRYPFNKNLPTTWLDFEYNELPKYLRKQK